MQVNNEIHVLSNMSKYDNVCSDYPDDRACQPSEKLPLRMISNKNGLFICTGRLFGDYLFVIAMLIFYFNTSRKDYQMYTSIKSFPLPDFRQCINGIVTPEK